MFEPRRRKKRVLTEKGGTYVFGYLVSGFARLGEVGEFLIQHPLELQRKEMYYYGKFLRKFRKIETRSSFDAIKHIKNTSFTKFCAFRPHFSFFILSLRNTLDLRY